MTTGGLTSNNARIDGDVLYRSDSFGGRVALLPARCRRGHDLGGVGYRARESDGVMRVRCNRCAASGESDPVWTLRTSEPVAEVDASAYPLVASGDV